MPESEWLVPDFRSFAYYIMGKRKRPLPELRDVEISGVAAEGKAIAKVKLKAEDEKPMVVFVPYGAPGDVVDVQVERKKHSFAEGRITRIVKPSSLRREPECKHFGFCGGCRWQHIPYSSQIEYKQQQVADALERIAKIELPPITPICGSDEEFGYRNKMEYTFSSRRWLSWDDMHSGNADAGESGALGFHVPGGFDKVMHVEHCSLQCELGNSIRNFIYQYALEHNLDFYNIRENAGLLRTLMIRTASTGENMVVVVFGRSDDAIPYLLKAVMDAFPEVTSLQYVINEKMNDSIADQDVLLFAGRDYIEEEMEGLRFRINAKSFYQTNSRQAYKLYSVARRLAFKGVEEDERPLVYDLYTGTGTIANFVARSAAKVIGIEYVEEAIHDARINSEVNGIDNTLFYAGDMKDILTDDFVKTHGTPDIIITDPPRAGMHEDVIKVIMNAAPSVIVYVSCNPATQARDLSMLDSMYKVTDVCPVDMFPQTHHVENVVRLEKR